MSRAAAEPIEITSEAIDLRAHPLLHSVREMREREGGLVDCYVPVELIDNEEVPVEDEYVTALAKNMRQTADKHGGSGQYTAVRLGLIEGETTLKITDGFHRSAALKLNGEDYVYATIKRTDWDELYNDRIFNAKDNDHIKFPRVVQWIREAWEHTELSEVMTVSQAVLLYRFDTDGSKLKLKPEDVAAAKAWIAVKEDAWAMQAMTIHGNLQIAESVDPLLVHATREKTDGKSLEAPTQTILKIFSKELPNNFAFQNLVMDTAKLHNLKGPEVRAICLKIKDLKDLAAAQAFIETIDWEVWEPEFEESKNRALRRQYDPRHKGARALDKTMLEITSVTDRVILSRDRGEEVTPEMRQKVQEALERTREIGERLGVLVVELSDLLEENPELPKDNPPVPEPVVEKAPVPKPKPAKPTSKQDAATKIVEEKPVQPVTPVAVPVPSVVPRTGEAGPETLGAKNYKSNLLSFMNGQADDFPDITTKQHVRWAKDVVIHEDASGPTSLREEIREQIAEAEQRLGMK